MFEENEDLGFSEFDKWYEDNFGYFKRGADRYVEPTLDVELFYTGVYLPVMRELPALVRKLVVKHYPVIGTEQRGTVLEAMNQKISMTGHSFLLRLYDLMQDKKEGVDLRLKYAEFGQWERRKNETETISRTIFDQVPGLTPLQKELLYELVKKEFPESYNYKDQLRYEFIEMFQPLIFKYCPAVQELDADGWVVYFHLMTIEHFDYRLRFEYFAEFIEYDFPEEDLYIPYGEFQKKFKEKFDERWEKNKRMRENGNEDLK